MYYQDEGLNIGKVIRTLFFASVVITLLLLAWYLFTHGAVSISTNSKTAVVSIAPEDNQTSESTKSSDGQLFSILGTGTYIVTATEGDKQVKQLIVVTPFHILNRTLSLADIASSEPVTNFDSSSFITSSQGISLFDRNQKAISSIDSSNHFSTSDPKYRFDYVSWRSYGNGLATVHTGDSDERVFMAINSMIPTEVPLPTPLTNQTYLSFLAGRSGSDFITEDGILYRRSAEGRYERIVDVDKTATLLSASTTAVALLSSNAETDCKIHLVSLATKKMSDLPAHCSQSSGYSFNVSWSPQHRYTAIANGSSLKVYNDALQEQYTIPDSNASSPLWLSDTELTYIAKNSVWKYNIDTKTSTAIGTIPLYTTVTNLQKKEGSSDLYFTGITSESSSLYRLVNKEPAVDILKINESATSAITDNCSLHFVNLTSFNLIISTSKPLQTSCDTDVNNYLSTIGISKPPVQYDLALNQYTD